jgi:predicted transcriptional regulator
MLVQLEQRLVQQIEMLARQQRRDPAALVQEAVEQYIARQLEEERFDAAIDRIIGEHAWLLNELAQR